MGVYDGGFQFDFRQGDAKKILIIGITVIIFLLLIFLISQVDLSFKQDALSTRFEKNPVKSGEQTKIFVTVTNNTASDAAKVPVSVSAKEKTEFDIYPINEKFNGEIQLLSTGTSREITFLVNPIGEVLPGTYTFVIKITINGQLNEKETVLTVQN
ncbi:MAG: hypothetical protein COV47_01175 [Candidatus Diapherotrites archaeon CG11_big_fil_rev_8_21_14_0_20_37_9]|nr:MAG: hypothetical protein COV47_01175 [Candidatus Diapherotrites archaeon CG11_big_fil_rev_8_21_14_0_20_37_9]